MRKVSFAKTLTIVSALFLAGCATDHAAHHGFRSAGLDPFAGKGSTYYNKSGPIPFGGGVYHVGSPYQIAGRWFTPHEQPGYDKTGLASWYGEAFHRRRTSNGEWFDMNTLTAAHATLPIPSYAMVTNLDNGRQVVVRINDRGPFVSTRILDVSKHAADVLGYRQKGTAHVRVKLIGPAPLHDSNAHMIAMNRALNNGAGDTQIAAMDNTTPAQMAELKPKKKQLLQPIQQAEYVPSIQQASGGYMVRVAVFHSLDNATGAYNTLAAYGPTQVIKAVGANGPLYRVQMGPLENEQDAQNALQSAISSGFDGARIVQAEITQVSSN